MTPKRSHPELLNKGDLILVELKAVKGMTMTKRGRVARIIEHGTMRQAITAEGAILCTWEPGKSTPGYTIIMLDKAPFEQKPLSLFDVMERVS
jgi:hypothetical protein